MRGRERGIRTAAVACIGARDEAAYIATTAKAGDALARANGAAEAEPVQELGTKC